MEKPICYSIYSTSIGKAAITEYEGKEYDEEEGYEEKGYEEKGHEEEGYEEKTILTGKWVDIGIDNYLRNPRS